MHRSQPALSTDWCARRRARRTGGYTLLVTISITAFMAALCAAAFQMTSSSDVMAGRERDIALVEAAADGAVEDYYAQWKALVVSKNYVGPLAADLANLTAPTASLHPAFGASGISFNAQSLKLVDPWGYPLDNANPNGYTAESKLPTGGFFQANLDNYPGWSGQVYYYRASSVAVRPHGAGIRGRTGDASIGVNRYFQITSVPLFQALIYFEEDLELNPGGDMVLTGKIHTNQDAWCMGYTKLQFMGPLSYGGTYTEGVSPERAGALGVGNDPTQPPYWADGLQSAQSTSKAAQLTKVARIEPFGTAPAALFNTADTNPNNDSFHELIEPPVAGFTDPAAIAQQRIYNKASVKVRVDSSKAGAARVTVTGTSLTAAQQTAFAAAVGTTVSLYDQREQKSVPVTSVDMAKMNTAIAALTATNGFNGVLYIDDNASGVNAIRLVNGAQINQDLTIASQDPIYIQGDFNTGGGYTDAVAGTTHNPNLVPSNNGGNTTGVESTTATGYNMKSVAVIGDAVMVLSNSWSDANASASINSRTASHTSINAAIMAGYLPTDYNNNNAPGGGAHNLVRFLENWSGQDFSYVGSMVQTYISQQYQGLWTTGNIYSPPNRYWSFNQNFLKNPPPGSVNGFVSSRGRWVRYTP